MGEQTETTTNQIGPQGAQARALLPQLQQLAQDAGLELGDLGDLASGNLEATAGDRELIETATGAAGDIARRDAERNYRLMRGQTEETLLSRGVGGSTIDAVTEAIQGGQFQNQLDDIGSTQQGQVAQGMLEMPLRRAETTISANRAILDRILGASQGVLGYDAQTRLGSGSSETTRPFDWAGAAQGIGQTAASIPRGGA